jgi:predicted AAA+ superfamily ATPase
MEKSDLLDILKQQEKRIRKFGKKEFIQRESLESLKRFFKSPHSLIITGPRRCGKSVLMSQIMNSYYKKFYYINFEDERLFGFNLRNLSELYEIFLELFGQNKTFFLDEIQNVRGWERWVRRLYDEGFKFFITGSNATMLSKELGTKLTGRHINFTLYPFSFREFLTYNNYVPKDLFMPEEKVKVKKFLVEYIEKGGFPEFLMSENIEILQEYFNDMIQKDIIERYNLANVRQIKELAKYLLTNSGNLTSYNKLSKLAETGSINTIIKYISHLEDAYILFVVPFFSYSLKKQTVNPFKVYPIDTGLRNSISFKFSKDEGRLYESIVAIELKRRNKEIYYWKNKEQEEVDFVVKKGLKVDELIQVCSNLSEEEVKKREIKSLLKASKELKCRKLLVITKDKEGEENFELFGVKRKIKFVLLWRWLLEK